MRNRIDKLGVAEPEIRKQGSDQIVIQLAGVHDPAAAAKLIGKTARARVLRLRGRPDRPLGEQRPAEAAGRDRDALRAALEPETRALADKGASQWYLFDANKTRRGRAGPEQGAPADARGSGEEAEAPDQGPARDAARPAEHRRRQLRLRIRPANCISAQQIPTNKVFYLLKHRLPDASGDNGIPEMTGNELKLSGTRADIDPQSNAAGRADAVHRQGEEGLPRDHAS